MEKHATAANTALGVFNALTTKSVQTDLNHILDDSLIHPRNKVFQLEQFFKAITPPNVAIAEQIKEEVSNISLALTYEDALRVANQIRDLQAELELGGQSGCYPYVVRNGLQIGLQTQRSKVSNVAFSNFGMGR